MITRRCWVCVCICICVLITFNVGSSGSALALRWYIAIQTSKIIVCIGFFTFPCCCLGWRSMKAIKRQRRTAFCVSCVFVTERLAHRLHRFTSLLKCGNYACFKKALSVKQPAFHDDSSRLDVLEFFVSFVRLQDRSRAASQLGLR